MRVFVTGHRGYIGAHLVELLRQAGHRVTGCDLGLFDGTGWTVPPAADVELKQDVRRLEPDDLKGHDCVMHLAALSNDPMGALDAGLTASVNFEASVRLARLAKTAGVPRFLFSGSCSIYGRGARDLPLTEEAATSPLTAYAQSKIHTEVEMLALADRNFTPFSLRNATAFGYSPVPRLDLVANDFLAGALVTGEIRIKSDGSPWRPLIHCRDIARAFVCFLDAPRESLACGVVNVGADAENYQVRQIAELVQALLPNTRVTFTGETPNDPRNYRVSFERLQRIAPGFRLAYCLRSGLEDMLAQFLAHGLNRGDLDSGRFIRLLRLRDRLPELEKGASTI